ncbi:MAG TPA: hypothetical protein PLJ35_20065 [Anaerolineae bacterium]|nr:hypothetical protein [Anaerolineae bacterium]HOR01117.1 hypothetical protein [Anaerolineae bacterium]HPL28300.1 hypothetical protein [Anaerolineae bacterium]
MAVPIRGLHLWASKYNDPYQPGFNEDLYKIQTIANLNSVKTTLFSFMSHFEPDRTAKRTGQVQKINRLREIPCLSTDQTFVYRCWPEHGQPLPERERLISGYYYNPDVPGDFVRDMYGAYNWYESGRLFAHNLLTAFEAIRNKGIPYVWLEVANEPNEPNEPFLQSMGAYNDFFRGFYWGQREIGFGYPLVYAGLSTGFNPQAWYMDYWVQVHIRDYADKVGVHVYWTSDSLREDSSPNGGRYYRTVKTTLQNAGIGPKGLMITEFNIPRSALGGNADVQDVLQGQQWQAWWRGAWADVQSGWWNEQAFLYVSKADPDPSLDDPYRDINDYQVHDTQLTYIQNA